MRVLLTSHRFWPHVGGTEEVVQQLASHYASRGHDVVVATSEEPDAPVEEERDGYLVRRFAMRMAGGFRVPPREYYAFVEDPGWHVVHLHGQRIWSTDHLYRRFARVKAPIVFTAHGFYQWHVERTPVVDTVYYKGVLPRVLRRCAAVTALTENERRELLEFGVADDLVRVIPDGFDPAAFAHLPRGFRARHGFPANDPLLFYVGGFYPNKRVDRLVEVAHKTGAPLAVVGKDQDKRTGRAYCEALAAKLGADVRFLGPLPREDVLAGYAESTLFLLGSDFEGFGLVLLEAMASGLPFVATQAGAAPDLAAQGVGVACPPERLAGEVHRLLRDPAARAALAAKGREVAPSYAWGPIADRYLALYEEVARA